jgi:hypothetical protein
MAHSTQDWQLYQIIQLKWNRLAIVTAHHPLVDQAAIDLGGRWETITLNEKQRPVWILHRDHRPTIEPRLAELFDQPLVPLTITFSSDQPIYTAPSIDGYALYDLHHHLLQRKNVQSPVVRDLAVLREELQSVGTAVMPALVGQLVVSVRCRRGAEIVWKDAQHGAEIIVADTPSAT